MPAAFSGATFPGVAMGPGSSVTLRHKTQIVSSMRGEETRMAGWGQPMSGMNITKEGAAVADLSLVRAFLSFHKGAGIGFYAEDFLDHSSAADHLSAPSETDEWVGIGDGTTDTFTLVKRYAKDTSAEVGRRVYGIDTNTIAVAVNDGLSGPVSKTLGTHYSLDAHAGTITFLAGHIPPRGHEITAGFRFKVRVHFDQSTDAWLGEAFRSIDGGDVDLDLVEEKTGNPVPERMDFGDAYANVTPAAHEVLEPHRGPFQFFSPTSPMTLYLPSIQADRAPDVSASGIDYAQNYQRGGPYFTIVNSSVTPGATITLKEVIVQGSSPPQLRDIVRNPVLNPGQGRSLHIVTSSPTFEPSSILGGVWVAE